MHEINKVKNFHNNEANRFKFIHRLNPVYYISASIIAYNC